jgi:hypothetical protein
MPTPSATRPARAEAVEAWKNASTSALVRELPAALHGVDGDDPRDAERHGEVGAGAPIRPLSL